MRRGLLLAIASVLTALFATAAAPSPAELVRVDSWRVNAAPKARVPARAAVEWCGTGQPTAVDRKPDADLSSPRQVHVTYAIPADGTDQFGAFGTRLATDAESMDVWWRREDPTRTLRFDLFAFPGCTAKFGRLDIGFVRLPRAGGSYLDDIGADRLIADLGQLANLTNLKHLVYYDGPPVFDDNVCGTAFVPRSATTNGGLAGIAFVWTKSLCGGDIGAGGLNAAVAVHELIHGLGSLQGVHRSERVRAARRWPRLRRHDGRALPVREQPDDDLRPDAGRGQERLLRSLPLGIRRPGFGLAHAPAPAAALGDDSVDGNAYRCRSARLANVVRVRPVVHARARPGSRCHARGCTARGSAVRSLDRRLHGQRLVRRDAQTRRAR